MAIWNGSLTVVNPINHAKDKGDQAVMCNLVVLPYAEGASEKITRVLNQHNIKVPHKPVRTLSSFFRRPKDQQKKQDTRGTVYKIKCNDCAAVCVNQMSRTLATRTNKHSKAAAFSDKKTPNWPNIPKKLATALILKTFQFFTSVPNGTSSCF